MSEKTCAMEGCGGKAVQLSNLFLHTLGPEPMAKPDFGEFVECQVWRCTGCGNVELHSTGETVNIPIRRSQTAPTT